MNMNAAVKHNALFGKPIAEEITSTVYNGVKELAAQGSPLTLLSITAGDVTAISLYVREQARGGEKAGGVGPVTVAILMRNALTAAMAQKKFYDETFGGASSIAVHVAPAQ